MKLLLTAATSAEIQQCLDYLAIKRNSESGIRNPDCVADVPELPHGSDSGIRDSQSGIKDWEIDVCIAGVGLMATTFSLTRKLCANNYDFVLQAGIGGTFDLKDELGKVVAIRSESLGDLGAEDHDQFIDIFELGFAQKDAFPFSEGRLVNPLTNIPFKLELPMVDSLTIHTVSGSAPTIASRLARHSVQVESMEGAALHYICLQMGIPFLQIRALSNYVTPRDRSSWQIGKAVKALNEQLIVLLEGRSS